eukprot:14328288-Alexandrium_andersonii.AAC.1
MSASLVGSEMCIRDSTGRGRCVPAGAQKPGSAANPGQPGVGSSVRARLCLLYTSDAADDM